MKLAHPDLTSPIEWVENRIPVLVVEEGAQFRAFATELLEQTEGLDGLFVLSDRTETWNLAKKVLVISDPLQPDFESRKIQTRLNQMAATAVRNFEPELFQLQKLLMEFGQKLVTDMDVNVCAADMFSTADIIKLLNLRVDTVDMDVPEKLLEFMRLMHSFFDVELFVFINLKSWLGEEELALFYRSVNYEKRKILLLEGFQRETPRPEEDVRILDKDLCEF